MTVAVTSWQSLRRTTFVNKVLLYFQKQRRCSRWSSCVLHPVCNRLAHRRELQHVTKAEDIASEYKRKVANENCKWELAVRTIGNFLFHENRSFSTHLPIWDFRCSGRVEHDKKFRPWKSRPERNSWQVFFFNRSSSRFTRVESGCARCDKRFLSTLYGNIVITFAKLHDRVFSLTRNLKFSLYVILLIVTSYSATCNYLRSNSALVLILFVSFLIL